MNTLNKLLLMMQHGGAAAPVFKPSDVSGLTLSLRSDAITGKVDNDIITTWTDLSGNGNSPTQAGSDTLKPLYKINIQNGLPSVRFDGINDYLKKAYTLNRPYTCYIVFTKLGWANNLTILDGAAGAVNRVRYYLGNLDTITDLEGNAPFFYNLHALTINNPMISRIIVDTGATASSITINGGAPVTGDTGNNNPGGITIASAGNITLFGNIDFFEILQYTGVVGVSDNTKIMNYLNARWAVF